MEVSLCERFTGLTPLSLRRERVREVFLLIRRYTHYAEKEQKAKKGGKKVIRRRASDDAGWW